MVVNNKIFRTLVHGLEVLRDQQIKMIHSFFNLNVYDWHPFILHPIFSFEKMGAFATLKKISGGTHKIKFQGAD